MPDSLVTDSAPILLCRPQDGATWSRLLTELPEELRRVLETSGGKQERHAFVARRDGRIAGLAFAYRRPVTAYLKLALLWAPGDAVLARELLAAFERAAAEEGAVVAKVEQGGGFPLSATALEAAGYRRLPQPSGAHLGSLPAGWIKPLAGTWPEQAPPYYSQTTGMTCGPCALGMGLPHLGAAPLLERGEELQLWREATTIYAPAGPGGCDPFGLAVAAMKRGLAATVYLSSQDAVLLNRASSDDKREVMRFVQQGFRREAAALGATAHMRAFEMTEIAAAVEQGALAILLIDEDLMHAEGGPHWILAHAHLKGGHVGDTWLVNDPWIDAHLGETWVDGSHLPISTEVLERLCWYGEPAYRSAVLLGPGA